jgi:DNA-binding MarR family transcriptional regulator
MGPLDGYLPYLLNRAGTRIATAFAEEVRPLGATLQMWRVLAALRERDGRRMGDLSATTSIEVSTLTRLVDGMEKRGLVARRRAAGDARVVALNVTAAGRQLTRRILPIARRYERVALAGFGPTEAATLKAALRRLYDNMDGLQKPHGPRG